MANESLSLRSVLRSVLLLSAMLTVMGPTADGSVLSVEALELQRLQGEWIGTGPGGPCSVTVTGHTLKFSAREDFWYETTITIPEAEQPQFYATIVKSSAEHDEGRVVVALYQVGEDTLTLGVVEDFDEAPTEPATREWDWIADIYELERAAPGTS